MFHLLFAILFFPIVLPFLLLRAVFKVLFALLLVPFVLVIVAGALFLAFASVAFALLTPILPFAVVALIIWALTRHSRAATVIPG